MLWLLLALGQRAAGAQGPREFGALVPTLSVVDVSPETTLTGDLPVESEAEMGKRRRMDQEQAMLDNWIKDKNDEMDDEMSCGAFNTYYWCLTNPGCGWCGNVDKWGSDKMTGKCVAGNTLGPMNKELECPMYTTYQRKTMGIPDDPGDIAITNDRNEAPEWKVRLPKGEKCDEGNSTKKGKSGGGKEGGNQDDQAGGVTNLLAGGLDILYNEPPSKAKAAQTPGRPEPKAAEPIEAPTPTALPRPDLNNLPKGYPPQPGMVFIPAGYPPPPPGMTYIIAIGPDGLPFWKVAPMEPYKPSYTEVGAPTDTISYDENLSPCGIPTVPKAMCAAWRKKYCGPNFMDKLFNSTGHAANPALFECMDLWAANKQIFLPPTPTPPCISLDCLQRKEPPKGNGKWPAPKWKDQVPQGDLPKSINWTPSSGKVNEDTPRELLRGIIPAKKAVVYV